jgi:hypothetical protein
MGVMIFFKFISYRKIAFFITYKRILYSLFIKMKVNFLLVYAQI